VKVLRHSTWLGWFGLFLDNPVEKKKIHLHLQHKINALYQL